MWVSDVVVLVDREQGGRRELGEWGCELYALFTMSELLGIYVDNGQIWHRSFADIQTYRALRHN